MRHSKQAEEMLNLMEIAEEVAGDEVKINKNEVFNKALKAAKAEWGDDVSRKRVQRIVNDAIKDAESTEQAVELATSYMRSDESIWSPDKTAGPGAKSYSEGNVYSREEVSQMLAHAQKFLKSGKQLDSWKYGDEWLNAVGNTMKQFVDLKKGDPALNYSPGNMKSAADDQWAYKPNKHDKASSSSDNKKGGPGPQRGKPMSTSHDINKMRDKSSPKNKTDYNK